MSLVWACDTTGQGITSKKECLTVVVFVDRVNPGIFVFYGCDNGFQLFVPEK